METATDDIQIQSNDLPQELVTYEILPRLPVVSLIRFRCVSKQWNSIISSHQFIKFHRQFQRCSLNPNQYLLINNKFSSFLTFDYSGYDSGRILPYCGSDSKYNDSPRSKEGLVELDLGTDLSEKIENLDGRIEISIVGSCDGLVCLDFGIDYIFLWNPSTQKSRKITYPPSFRKKETIWGFGYVSYLDDYKVVSLSQKLHSYKKKAHTLSLRHGEWGKIDVLDGYNVDSLNNSGVLVDEMVFWRMINGLGLWCIIGFDFVGERFIEVEVPEWIGTLRDFFLSVMEGRLCVCWGDNEGGVKIARLKQYGDWGSWTKLYSFGFESFYCCNLFGYTRAGKFLMDTLEGSILLINMNKDPPTYMEILRLATSKDVVNVFESFVSPFGLVEA